MLKVYETLRALSAKTKSLSRGQAPSNFFCNLSKTTNNAGERAVKNVQSQDSLGRPYSLVKGRRLNQIRSISYQKMSLEQLFACTKISNDSQKFTTIKIQTQHNGFSSIKKNSNAISLEQSTLLKHQSKNNSN